MKPLNTVSRTSTALSPARVVGRCWKLSLELRNFGVSFWLAVTLLVQRMTQGQSEGRAGAELHMLAGREQGLQTSRALAGTGELPLLGSGFEPISEQPCLKGFSSNSFTCHVSVILLTSITAVSSSASCLVDIGLFCRKDAFNRAGPRVGERP